MIRIVFFDLGQTLVDARQRPFAHVAAALTTIAGFRTAAGKPLQSALVSDFTMVAPPLTPARVKPVFEQYLALLAATGLRGFFEPVSRRVTLSTHAGVGKPDRAIFEKALSRLRTKAVLAECVLITEDAGHVAAVRHRLGMQAMQFGADFKDWSQAPALLAHLLGTQDGANVHAAVRTHLAARGVEGAQVQGGGTPGEYEVSGTSWHKVAVPGHPMLQDLQVALPARARVKRGPRGELRAKLSAPDTAALAEAVAFAGSLAANGQIAGVGSAITRRAGAPTHAIEASPDGGSRLVRKRFSAI